MNNVILSEEDSKIWNEHKLEIRKEFKIVKDGEMKTTNGAFIIDSLGKILLTHATNHQMSVWSIPKGLTDEGETSYEAVVRETIEETTLDLTDYTDDTIYKYLGKSLYRHKKKKLLAHFFLIDKPLSDSDSDLYCDSTFTCDVTGMTFYENDITEWKDIEFADKYLHYTQKVFLKEIKELLVKQIK